MDEITTTFYYNNNWQVLTEIEDNRGDVVERDFVYGNYIDEVLIMVADDGQTEDTYFYAHDHLYSPVALMESDGDVVERYEYDAYGRPTIWNADFTIEHSFSYYGNPYCFTGRRVDFIGEFICLQYSRNRYYDYYTGRWLTPDRTGYTDSMNLYQYVGSNPISYRDPMGLYLYPGCCEETYPDPDYPKDPRPDPYPDGGDDEYYDWESEWEGGPGVTRECCENIIQNIPELSKDLFNIYFDARFEGDIFGSCLNEVYCSNSGLWCRDGIGGYYNPFTRNVVLCYENIPDVDTLIQLLTHELIHAVSVCGWWDIGCKACMKEEMAAYYYSGMCSTKEDCAEEAWGSCTMASLCALDDLFGGEPEDYEDVGPWPPEKPWKEIIENYKYR